MLARRGKPVGNTREIANVKLGPYKIPISMLFTQKQHLLAFLSDEVWRREEREYKQLQGTALRVLSDELRRDPAGRRAVVSHPGCISYQHFFIRQGWLHCVVHMRSLDVRKLSTDLYQLVTTGNHLANWHAAVVVHGLQLTVYVDCLHRYLKPGEVPL